MIDVILLFVKAGFRDMTIDIPPYLIYGEVSISKVVSMIFFDNQKRDSQVR